MDVEFMLVRMAASMWGNSSGVLNMDLVITTSETGTNILGNIFPTRCMALVFINLEMDTAMRGLGMKEEGRDLVHTLSEMVRHNPVTGKMVLSMFLAHKILDPESFTLSRKHGELLRKLVTLQRLTRECIKLCQLQTKQPMLPEWWLLKLSRNKCIIITVKKYRP
ncbi:hypothetical protein Goari_026321 [Gossypium aridum]|uniref:Uncharacterized protein n=1 Tax=Gossypium aridum TaxID=34290 RepID=A0A7J8XBT8_GOSAI|nr:hypothetical protein [Gossypium aridum]